MFHKTIVLSLTFDNNRNAATLKQSYEFKPYDNNYFTSGIRNYRILCWPAVRIVFLKNIWISHLNIKYWFFAKGFRHFSIDLNRLHIFQIMKKRCCMSMPESWSRLWFSFFRLYGNILPQMSWHLWYFPHRTYDPYSAVNIRVFFESKGISRCIIALKFSRISCDVCIWKFSILVLST